MSSPTLSGAQVGRVRPWREVPGGLKLDTAEGLITKPCALRLIKEAQSYACTSYARQYLAGRGDKTYLPGELTIWSQFFQLHMMLIELPEDGTGPLVPLCPLPISLVDPSGKLSPQLVATLPLNEAVTGELGRLWREYEILRDTEAPVSLDHAKWEAIVSEGKAESLRTLVLRHGSSALIQVLHGMGSEYPE